MDNLKVYIEIEGRHTLAGYLSIDSANYLSFRYDDSYIYSPISISLPKEQSFSSHVGHNFFVNLLPEERIRAEVAAMLGISQTNVFKLLAEIGGECAGAISIVTNDPAEPVAGYDEISPDDLVNRIKNRSFISLGQSYRLSLAGAQGKIPLCYCDGKFLLPKGGTASTHIVKFASDDFPDIVDNEYYFMKLAKDTGVPVAECHKVALDGMKILIVDRYDRVSYNNKTIRLHQEDFCQILGLAHSSKYENDYGFINLGKISAIISKYSSNGVLDTQNVIKWVLFNYIIGNADAHGKNLSMLYSRDMMSIRLAPFYDIVSTAVYNNLDINMALSMGGERSPLALELSDLFDMSEDLGVPSKGFLKITKEAIKSFEKQYQNRSPYSQKSDAIIYERLEILKRIVG